MAVVQRLAQNTRLSHTRFIRAGDSGRPLLTGGRCSEVAVSTGLTVHLKNNYGLIIGLEFCQEFRVSQVKNNFHNFGFLKDFEIALGGVGIASHFYESINLYNT
jgi:hypothetical protein